MFDAGRLTSPVAFGNKAMKCEGSEDVLQTVLMANPDQASSLQGSHSVNCDILALNDLGIGSGWQQSKQNQALLAVVGTLARTGCSLLSSAELSSLRLFFLFFSLRICAPIKHIRRRTGCDKLGNIYTGVSQKKS